MTKVGLSVAKELTLTLTLPPDHVNDLPPPHAFDSSPVTAALMLVNLISVCWPRMKEVIAESVILRRELGRDAAEGVSMDKGICEEN
ncbi:unnamed protein product [Allacma fusca]|uniref:Uncharacterized protein n=1 Tax=Allacma fusca TaxID=39272 RepID=A0A8J2JLQ8_9HEXA|nr:unnamed protein product [Allacma fusca]